ncbi:MAG: hypothetical protein AVDCRST_MAG78-1670, partial [uncultured Rubrobacteraceae bacterium]
VPPGSSTSGRGAPCRVCSTLPSCRTARRCATCPSGRERLARPAHYLRRATAGNRGLHRRRGRRVGDPDPGPRHPRSEHLV